MVEETVTIAIKANVAAFKKAMNEAKQSVSKAGKSIKEQADGMSESIKKAGDNAKKTRFSGLTESLKGISPVTDKAIGAADEMKDRFSKAGKAGKVAMGALLAAVAGLAIGIGIKVGKAIMDISGRLAQMADPVRFDQASSKMQESIKKLKTSLGTITAPAFEWMANAVSALADGLTWVVEKLAQFIGLLQGLLGISSKDNQSLGEMADNMDEAGASADAGLASFDKLNTLDTGEMGDMEQAQKMADLMAEARKSGADLAKKIKDAFDLKNITKAIKEGLIGVWDSFKEKVTEAWDWVKKKAREVWDEVVAKILGVWEDFKAKVTEAWEWVKTKAAEVWDSIVAAVLGVWDSFKEKVTEAWDWLKTKADEIWTSIKDSILGVWDSFKEKVTDAWNWLKTKAEEVWTKIKDSILGVWEDFKAKVTEAWDELLTKATEIWTQIKDAILGVWEEFKTAMEDAWDKVLEKAKQIWEDVKAKITQVWDDVKAYALEKFTNLKDDIIGLFDDAWQAVKSGFDKILGPIKSAVEWLIDKVEWLLEKIDSAKDAVSGAVGGVADSVGGFFGGVADSIKGVFGFAQGGVFQPNSPQLAILGDNKTEPEVAAPYSMIVQAVGDALARMGGGGGGVYEIPISIDGRVIARATYDYMEMERMRRGSIS